MIGQIQVLDVPDIETAGPRLLEQKQRLIDLANSRDPVIVSLHGGARDVEVRTVRSAAPRGRCWSSTCCTTVGTPWAPTW